MPAAVRLRYDYANAICMYFAKRFADARVVMLEVAERARRSALWLGEEVLRRSVPLPNAMRLRRARAGAGLESLT